MWKEIRFAGLLLLATVGIAYAASPMGKIPAFIDGDFRLADSSAIAHYLDAKYPAHRLIPQQPEALGRTIWFDEFGDTVLVASFGKIFFNRIVAPKFLGREGDEAAAREGEAELPRLFDYLESVVPAPGGFLVGDALSLADIAVASPFVNLSYCRIAVDAAKWPQLAAWLASVLERPSFIAAIALDRTRTG